ncbi:MULTISPECIES: UbiA family prenyltransferase [unclassified Streptomyces]|uniref:UbiA family prenyltransferase n=1 Tax=unclassified Streptomyces TaxID=2593676 RepID=UPI002DD9C4B3|nr:UbiA family prenyltransferase [Streptomyces sp. NBC_00243]WRZ18612.1 UbiA family prenyltransferase [Streptomyces sp. NBC_00243]
MLGAPRTRRGGRAGAGAGAQARSEAGGEAGVEARSETGTEAGIEAGSRASGEAAVEAGSETWSKAAAETGSGTGTKVGVEAGSKAKAKAWAELLRLPALFTVPGDALAGAAAVGARPNSRTLLAIGSSLCLYEAGMALNDWADRAEDAVDRPHRPLPSGRIHPAAALAAAGALTAAGLALAARAGGPSLAVAAPLAATVWAYDLVLKRTPAGPAAMATARGLDVLLGATTTGRAPRGAPPLSDPKALRRTAARGLDVLPGATTTGRPPRGAPPLPGPNASRRTSVRHALPTALTMAGHTLAVTAVSRRETQGGSSAAPLAALATTAALAWRLMSAPTVAGHPGASPVAVSPQPADLTPTRPHPGPVGASRPASVRGRFEASIPQRGRVPVAIPLAWLNRAPGLGAARNSTQAALCGTLALAYAATFARPLFHAVLNPSPPLTQRAVGGGIRAMIPLQAALAARAGAPVTALLTAALAPAARKFARKVSVT